LSCDPCSSERVSLAIRPEKTEVFRAGEVPGDAEPSNLIRARSKLSRPGSCGSPGGAHGRRGSDLRCDREGIRTETTEQGEEIFLYFPPEAFWFIRQKRDADEPADKLHGTVPKPAAPSMFVSDRWLTGVTTVFLLACLVFFMLYPVYDICKLSFFRDGLFTSETMPGTYQSAIFRSLTNSLYVSIMTMVITTVAAFFFAYGLTRTTIRGRGRST